MVAIRRGGAVREQRGDIANRSWDNSKVPARAGFESPELSMLAVNGLELAVWEWPGADPPLLFAHATGFHGRCWDQIIRMLRGRRALAVDFRGHGRSNKPDPPYHWPAFGQDLAAIADRLGLRHTVAIGHSMGGHSIVYTAGLLPECFAALILIDPTILRPELYRQAPFDASFIRRRRAVWQSPDEMFERFRSRRPFASWRPEVLRDYCQYGLLPNGSEFILACPPAVEASIYEHSTAPDSDLYTLIPGIRQPVTVIRAGTLQRPGVLDPAASPTAPDLAAKFPNAHDTVLTEHSHYIPMECPELVAEAIGGAVI